MKILKLKRHECRAPIALALALSIICGCTAVRNPQSIENKAYAVTRIVSSKVLQRHPEYRLGMEVARSELEVMSKAEVVSLAELNEIISRLPIAGRTGEDVALYVEAGLLFFSDELGQVAVTNPEAVRRAAAGMTRALAATLAAP